MFQRDVEAAAADITFIAYHHPLFGFGADIDIKHGHALPYARRFLRAAAYAD